MNEALSEIASSSWSSLSSTWMPQHRVAVERGRLEARDAVVLALDLGVAAQRQAAAEAGSSVPASEPVALA